jgi:hypothetical protein
MRTADKQSRSKPKLPHIHPLIKEALGYAKDDTDAEVLRDWRARLRRVCKPCWELKYCPYGPLVEQAPLLPPERAGAIEHNEYLKDCLASGQMGEVQRVTKEERAFLERLLNDQSSLEFQARHEIRIERIDAHVAASPNPVQEFESLLHGELPPIHEYRANYEIVPELDWNELNPEEIKYLRKKIRERKAAIKQALKTGFDDKRKPLDPTRKAMFEKSVSRFDPEKYPESIPDVFSDGQCNIFGHICPVFFAAEAYTETSTERRRGRYIPFAVKMRVVRRDNHTCQHCGKHLADNEVEFDHNIPIAKGGSSEEYNVRLTCFECNRDKKDKIEI